jgi:hypothetical protein
MSFRWAISLIRVSGTEAVNSNLNEGKRGCILRIKRTSLADVAIQVTIQRTIVVKKNNNKKFQFLSLKLVRHLFVQSLPCSLNLIRSCPVDRNDRFWIKYHARDLTHLCQLRTKTMSNTILDTSRKVHTSPGVYCSSVHHFLVHHIPLSNLRQAIFLPSSIMILEPRRRQNPS